MQQKSKLYGFLAFARDDPLQQNQVTHRCVADKEGKYIPFICSSNEYSSFDFMV